MPEIVLMNPDGDDAPDVEAEFKAYQESLRRFLLLSGWPPFPEVYDE